jgi:hypothetical protein
VPPPPAPFAVILLPERGQLRIQRAVGRRDGELSGALEHGQLPGLLGDHRDGLDGGSSGADDCHPLARQVNRLVRPVRGVQRQAPEHFGAREDRLVRRRQAADRRDQVGRGGLGAVRGPYGPPAGVLVVAGAGDPGIESEVVAQLQPVGDVLEILQDLGLSRIALLQRPFLLQVRQERVRVVHALRITPGPRIAIPVPGPADAAACFETPHRHALFAEQVQHVEPGETGADHDRVRNHRRAISDGSCATWLFGHGVLSRGVDGDKSF